MHSKDILNKEHIEKQLKPLVSDRFIELWWDLKLPGLGNVTPREAFSADPDALYRYVQAYKEI